MEQTVGRTNKVVLIIGCESDFWIGEGHPTAIGHQIMAEKLVEALELRDGDE